MRRDFGNGWFGLRRIVDAWLLDREAGNLDFLYINSVLQKMDIAAFCKRMSWLGCVCMGEEQMDADAELLLGHAFACGIFGNETSYKAGRIASLSRGGLAKGKMHSMLAAIFLPYSRMKAHFPVLERIPVLLPIYWVLRAALYLRNGDIRLYWKMLDYSNVREEDVEYMRKIFEAGSI